MNDEVIKTFFERLDELNSGDRAALRREAGVILKDAKGQAIRTFYQCLPYAVPQWQEGRWFAAGCLHCLWSTDTTERISIKQTLYRLGTDPDVSESTAHRLESLLDLKWDIDGYMLTKLSRLARLIKSKGLAIDCADLLRDLIGWNSDSQSVQRKWAKAMYAAPNADEESKEGE